MNGGASAVVGLGANWYAWAIDTNASDNVVDSFTGSASGTTAAVNKTIRIVDGHGLVCTGTSISSTPACATLPCNVLTVQVCNTEGSIAGCTESATSAAPSLTVQIEDANGFIDDSF